MTRGRINRLRLEQAIRCLQPRPRLTKTSVHKLLYLVEREAVLRTGKPAIGIEFTHQKFGMFSAALADELDALVSEKFLTATPVVSDEGEGTRYTISKEVEVRVDPGIQELCDAVKGEIGRFASLSQIIRVAKSTTPYLYSRRGERIDWDLLAEERCEGDHRLSAGAERELIQAGKHISEGRGEAMSRDDAVRRLQTPP